MDNAEQILDLPGGQRGGWLIHNKYLGVGGKGLGNLHHLLLGDRQLSHHLLGIQVDLQFVQDALGFTLHGRVVQFQALSLFPAQEHILGHRQVLAHIQLLVDNGHAHLLSQLGGQVAVLLAEDLHGALVSLVYAAEHLHQGALSRTVLSQQGHDLPRAQFKVHMVQRLDPGESLADPLHGYDGFLHSLITSSLSFYILTNSSQYCLLLSIDIDSLSGKMHKSKGGIFRALGGFLRSSSQTAYPVGWLPAGRNRIFCEREWDNL